MTPEQEKELTNRLTYLMQYFPFRIVWGYIDGDGEVCAFASHTRHKLNAAIRKGFHVYQAHK